jgi:hypothetical protein
MLEGIKLEMDKVCTITLLPEPTCHCDIQVVLDCVNFYRNLITSFLHLRKLITDMLKGERIAVF